VGFLRLLAGLRAYTKLEPVLEEAHSMQFEETKYVKGFRERYLRLQQALKIGTELPEDYFYFLSGMKPVSDS
jgi:hypothetical protein